MAAHDERSLVEALYDAALGHRSWEDVNRQLLRHVDGQTLMMSVLGPRPGEVDVLGWLGLPSESMAEYPTFAPHDVWANGYVERRLFGSAAIGSHIVDDRTFTRSLIYNEYLRPKVNVFHLVGSVSPLAGGHRLVLGLHRPRDARDFSLDEAGRLQRVLPHLQRALEVRQRLRQAEQMQRSLHAALDRMSIGVILMGRSGQLLHLNAAADAILRNGDGLVRVPGGLRASGKEDDERLQALIGALSRAPAETRSSGGHIRIARPSGQPAYAVMLAPAGASVVSPAKAAPAILIFISNPGEKIVSDLAVLNELFGFPAGEARLVLALMSGTTVPDFARQAGITYNTVRTLLSRAMARTGTRSQVELVLLVATSIGHTTPLPPA